MKSVLPYLVFLLGWHASVGHGTNSLEFPKIIYCTYNNESGDCHANAAISNSTFVFGQYSQNVLFVQRGHLNVKLKCAAPYPVRWLAQHPLGNVIYIDEDQGERQPGNPPLNILPAHSQQTILLRRLKKNYDWEEESKIFRCESIVNPSLAAETYVYFYSNLLVPPRFPFLHMIGFQRSNVKTYFILNISGETPMNEAGYTVPCVAEDFYGNFTALLFKSDREIMETMSEQKLHTDCQIVIVDVRKKTREIFSVRTDGCTECVCVGQTLCRELGFCYDDASSGSPFNCPSTSRYAHGTLGCLKAEVSRRTQNNTNYDSDCDDNTLLIWDNATHGISVDCKPLFVCSKPEWDNFKVLENVGWNGVLTENVYENCLKRKQVEGSKYDPRVGYKMTPPPEFNSTYQCLSFKKDHTPLSVFLAPIDSRQKLKANLERNDDDSGNGEISCFTEAGEHPLQLDVGNCSSLIECDLMWKPLSSDIFPVENDPYNRDIDRIHMSKRSQRHQPKFWHGYLHCWGILQAPTYENNSRSLKYFSEVNHFFTGIDHKLYLLSDFVMEAVIGIGMTNDFEQRKLQRLGDMYIGVCKISTFVLHRNIQFVVEYDNNPNSSKLVADDNQSVPHDVVTKRITTNVEERCGIESVQLTLRASANVTKVSCFAPWRNSTSWAKVDVTLDSYSVGSVRNYSSMDVPKIFYCTYNDDKGDCSAETPISDTAFEFGHYAKNLLFVDRYLGNIKLKCIAPYSVRWLAQHPLGNVSYIAEDEAGLQLGNPLKLSHVQSQQTILLRRFQKTYDYGMESKIFRCESFENSSLASEIYLRFKSDLSAARRPPYLYTRGFQKTLVKSYFMLSTLGETLTKEAGFTVPCVADDFYGNFTAKLLKSGRDIMTTSEQRLFTHCVLAMVSLTKKTMEIYYMPTDGCAECVCVAKFICKEFGFCVDDNGSRSPFGCKNISPYAEGKTESVNEEASSYIGNNSNYYSDCNNDTLLIWDNGTHGISVGCFPRLEYLCTKPEWRSFTYRENEGWTNELSRNVYENCLIKREVERSKYDPRVGYKVTQQPDFNSAYQCLSHEYDHTILSLFLAPINSRQKLNATLEFNYGAPGTGEISCNTKAGEHGLQLDVANCNSLIECELKWKPLASDVFPVENDRKTGEMQRVDITQGSKRHQLRFRQGFLHCWGILHLPSFENESSPLKYVSEMDYFFTGIDLKHHLLSKSPIEAIIGIGMANDFEQRKIRRIGATYAVACKISTFVLVRNIQFTVEYDNDPSSSTLVAVGDQSLPNVANTKRITTSVEDAVGVESVQLVLQITPNMTKVSCFAPWRNSSNWARAEADLDSRFEGPASTRDITLGISVSGVLAFLLAVVLVVIWRKYTYAIKHIQELTQKDIDEFHFGNPSRRLDGDENIAAEAIAFDSSMQIPNDSLQLGVTILGEGQFGIVQDGVFADQPVAIKSSKLHADIEYFKEFLKEIKVMAYVGVHENVVQFLGASVDRIREQICYAVMELSPFGNLCNYLRNHRDTYSHEQITMRTKDDHSHVILTQSVLISFCKQIASAMEFISHKMVIHGDLATRNILVFENNVVKISDFGLSKKLYDYKTYVKQKGARLPWRWMSPESIRFYEFSSKSDIWSFGVTAWEIFSFGEVPFSGVRWSTDFVNRIEAGLRLPKPLVAPKEVYDLLMQCWENRRDERPNFTECKGMFINLECESIKRDKVYGTMLEGTETMYSTE